MLLRKTLPTSCCTILTGCCLVRLDQLAVAFRGNHFSKISYSSPYLFLTMLTTPPQVQYMVSIFFLNHLCIFPSVADVMETIESEQSEKYTLYYMTWATFRPHDQMAPALRRLGWGAWGTPPGSTTAPVQRAREAWNDKVLELSSQDVTLMFPYFRSLEDKTTLILKSSNDSFLKLNNIYA